MHKKELVFKGKKIMYRVVGDGPAVMLLHGFGEDGSIWKNQFHSISGYKLIIPDLPGSGQSEMIDDMSLEGMAEVIKEIIQTENKHASHLSEPLLYSEAFPPEGFGEAGGKRTILIGHSMGGYIALAFAEKWGHLLNGLGLFHSTSYADDDQKKEVRQKGIDFIQKHGAFEFLKTTIPNLYAPSTNENKKEKVSQHIESGRNFSASSLVSYYRAMMQRPDRTHILQNSTIPILFILGRHDNAIPLQDGLKQSYLPDISYIHILENSGHMGMLEEVNSSNEFLKKFLAITQHHLTS